jgi:flagellar motor switch protein FliN/FliY
MADEAPNLKQDDIEELLRQAQRASGVSPDSATAPDAAAQSHAAAQTAMLEPSRSSFAPAKPAGNIGDDVQFLLNQAEQAIASVEQPVDSDLAGLAPFELKDLAGAPASGEKATLELLSDVDLDLRIELGRTQMFLEDVLKLKRGSVVTLNKLAGDPVDVFVNGRMVARGEVLVLNDNFCVRVTELLSGDDFD